MDGGILTPPVLAWCLRPECQIMIKAELLHHFLTHTNPADDDFLWLGFLVCTTPTRHYSLAESQSFGPIFKYLLAERATQGTFASRSVLSLIAGCLSRSHVSSLTSVCLMIQWDACWPGLAGALLDWNLTCGWKHGLIVMVAHSKNIRLGIQQLGCKYGVDFSKYVLFAAS